MKLIDLLKIGVKKSPDKIAVTHGKRNITYMDLYKSVLTLAGYLRKTDLRPGSRVGILYDNSVEYIVSFFAVTYADLIPVPLDSSLKADMLSYILSDCQAEGLILQDKYAGHLDYILDHNSQLKMIISDKQIKFDNSKIKAGILADILASENAQIKAGDLDIDDSEAPHELATIFFTSGSSGVPKGVMLSHRNLVSNTLATVEYLKLTADDSIMVILPFYYIYGNSLMLTHLACGGRIVIDNRFAFPQVVLDTMARENVSGFSGVPSSFMIMLNNANFESSKLPDLRYLTQAGGGMAPEIIRRVMTAFPDKEIYIMYGQTEASPRVSYLPPEMLAEHIGSIGIPVPGVTIHVVDETGHEVPGGQVGEIAVFGDCVMMGYWNQPEEQSQVLRDGWLYTGDLAKRDESGLLYIVSRKKEILKVGGNRVSSREVEDKLLEHPKILEAAIIGVSDDILGEAIKAFIVLKNEQSLDAREIQDYCKLSLAVHKVPKYVEFLDTMPKTQAGKINKQMLKGM